MTWKDAFKEGSELVLATCGKDGPHANIAVSLGFVDNKLLIADCQMQTTVKNLKANPKICVIGKYLRLKGSVEVFLSGKYFDVCVEKAKEYKVKSAIVISPEEVFDLDKCKKVL